MKTKCYSVRLESLVRISDKAYKARAYDGSEAILPASHIFGKDYEVLKSEAYWISEWILNKKQLQFSTKKVGYFSNKTNRIETSKVIIQVHKPAIISAVESNIIESLKK